MTLPYERGRSVNTTREFLYKLLDPKETPRVPRKIRKWAGMCLRHFPHEFEIGMAQEKQPELWGDYEKKKK